MRRWLAAPPRARCHRRVRHHRCFVHGSSQRQAPLDDDDGGRPPSLVLRARGQVRERWAELRQHEKVLAMMASTSLMMSGHGVMTPVLPLLADSLGATAAQLGLSLSAFAAARLVLNVPLGILADRYGRRLLLVAGPLVNAAGMAGSGWAATVPELVLWRLVAGAGNAAYLGGAQMYLNDISTPENRARVLGAHHGALLFGVGLGPAIGGLMADGFGLQAPCAVVGITSALTALYSFSRLPETNPNSVASAARGASAAAETEAEAKPDRRSAFSAAGAMLRDPRLLAAGVANASTFALRQGGSERAMPTPARCSGLRLARAARINQHVSPNTGLLSACPCAHCCRERSRRAPRHERARLLRSYAWLAVLCGRAGGPSAHLPGRLSRGSGERFTDSRRAGVVSPSSGALCDVLHGESNHRSSRVLELVPYAHRQSDALVLPLSLSHTQLMAPSSHRVRTSTSSSAP
jgi:MFS family permease